MVEKLKNKTIRQKVADFFYGPTYHCKEHDVLGRFGFCGIKFCEACVDEEFERWAQEGRERRALEREDRVQEIEDEHYRALKRIEKEDVGGRYS